MNQIKIVNNVEEANAITHSGTFHADDIFSTIFLAKFQEVFLFRTNEYNKISNNNQIVFDIGCGEFDHHGDSAKVRANGVKYCAFGLLFEKFGRKYLKEKQVEDIEEVYQMYLKDFILQIDAIDNGIFPARPKDYNILTLSSIIELYNPTWKEAKDTNATFLEAIQIGNLIFERIEKRILDKLAAKTIVEEQLKKTEGEIIQFEEYLPFMDFLLSSNQENAKNILFAIFPSNRGGYNIRAINKEIGSFKNRLDFPKEWGGKSKEELYEMTQIKTFRFCHSNLFLCSCDELEDAIKIAKLALKQK